MQQALARKSIFIRILALPVPFQQSPFAYYAQRGLARWGPAVSPDRLMKYDLFRNVKIVWLHGWRIVEVKR